jgi:hypothetical protein
MFEEALRLKLRWQYRGSLCAEDLWDLSCEALDSIYQNLNRVAREQQQDSLLSEGKQDDVLQLKIGIIKHIVGVKLEERQQAKNEAARAAKKRQLLEVLERKQEQQLEELSPEEIQAMIEEL